MIEVLGTSFDGSFASGIYTNSLGTGNAGSLNITTEQLILAQGGEITTASIGSAGGDIQINTRTLQLDNGRINASISGEGAFGEGGNINLTVGRSLILRNSSQISTRAGTQDSGGGNGGNITINGGFVIAVPRENSDINANAFQGNGGNITINTPGLFGIQLRNQQTNFSDITASSQFGINGTFNLNLQAIDITPGLVQLPEELIEPINRIVAGCPTDRDANFTIVGRGGLPEDPRQVLRGQVVLQDLRSPVATYQLPVERSQLSVERKKSTIIEAQGWILNQEGQVELVANDTATSNDRLSVQRSCLRD